MNVESKVRDTIKKYKLLSKRDKVVVALSGGKDSTTILYLLKKHGYNVHGLMIDLHLGNWSDENKKNMIKFCRELHIKLKIMDLRKEFGFGICFIKDILKRERNLSGCTVCGIIKRWILNKWAKKLKADKIVTGHNLDDECQTILMNFLKGNIFLGVNSTPATGAGQGKEKGFAQRVKPLFFIPENEIRKYSKKMKFPVLYQGCPCAFGTYRIETRDWMKQISDKEKLRIVKSFQKLIPMLRRKNKNEIKQCKVCGEPSRGEICNACKIFEHLKGI